MLSKGRLRVVSKCSVLRRDSFSACLIDTATNSDFVALDSEVDVLPHREVWLNAATCRSFRVSATVGAVCHRVIANVGRGADEFGRLRRARLSHRFGGQVRPIKVSLINASTRMLEGAPRRLRAKRADRVAYVVSVASGSEWVSPMFRTHPPKERALQFPVQRAVHPLPRRTSGSSSRDPDCVLFGRGRRITTSLVAEGLDLDPLRHPRHGLALAEEVEEKLQGVLWLRCVKDLIEDKLFDPPPRSIPSILSINLHLRHQLVLRRRGRRDASAFTTIPSYDRSDLEHDSPWPRRRRPDGRSDHIDTWPENTADVTSLLSVGRSACGNALPFGWGCVVADRGMIPRRNHHWAGEEKLSQILGETRQRSRRRQALFQRSRTTISSVPLLVERKAGEMLLFVGSRPRP